MIRCRVVDKHKAGKELSEVAADYLLLYKV